MVAQFIFQIYRWIKTLGLRGRGLLLRSTRHLPASLRRFPISFPGGIKMEVDLAKPEAFPLLDLLLGDEAQLDALMKTIAKGCTPGAVLWDVGGNVGLVSIHFADPAFKLAAIHTFEPIPELVEHLKTLFCGTRVTVHPFTLGETESTGLLNIPLHESATASLVQAHEGESKQVAIEIRTGDHLIEQGCAPVPDLIKIDVEGFEPQVIQGLEKTIRTHHPILFIEHLFQTEAELEAMIPEGYTLLFIADKNATLSDCKCDRILGHNCVLLPQERLSQLLPRP